MTSSEILRTSLLLSFLDDCIPAAHHALLKASTARTGSSLNLGWCKHPDQQQELVLPSNPAGASTQVVHATLAYSRSLTVHPSAFVLNGPKIATVETLG